MKCANEVNEMMRFGRTVNLLRDDVTCGRVFRLGSVVAMLLTFVLFSLAEADEPATKTDGKKKTGAEATAKPTKESSASKTPLSAKAGEIEPPAKEKTESKPPQPIKPQPQKSAGEKSAAERKGAPGHKAMSGKPASADSSNGAFEPISPKREAAAVYFAKQHHPELAELLDRLKASHPDQYTKAIRELDRTRDKLEKQRERDTKRYAFLLREWQLDSRVRLLAARMTMGGTPELEAELRQVLVERHDVRLQLLTYDRERSKARWQKVDEQIAEHVQYRAVTIDRELEKIKRNADTRKRSLPKSAIKRSLETDTKDAPMSKSP